MTCTLFCAIASCSAVKRFAVIFSPITGITPLNTAMKIMQNRIHGRVFHTTPKI